MTLTRSVVTFCTLIAIAHSVCWSGVLLSTSCCGAEVQGLPELRAIFKGNHTAVLYKLCGAVSWFIFLITCK